MDTRTLGRTGLTVSSLCLGTSPLGNFPAQYGYEVSREDAVATVREVLRSPINFIDTSNNYGDGESECRIGLALAEEGGLPETHLLATKVDPLPGSNDFSGKRVRKSVDESLTRLGLDRLQLVYLHDPERITFGEATAPGGPIEALVDLQSDGVIKHLGVAGGPIDLMLDYLATDVFDAVISHNRFTLVDQSASPLVEEAERRGVAFVNGAPFGGGMLVKGPDAHPNYAYRPTEPQVRERVRSMQQVCQEYDVPLAAAALQYSLRNPAICSTIVGMSRPTRVASTLALAQWQIPTALWEELEPLVAAGHDGALR